MLRLQLVFRVLRDEMAILRWKVAEFGGPKIFLSAAGCEAAG